MYFFLQLFKKWVVLYHYASNCPAKIQHFFQIAKLYLQKSSLQFDLYAEFHAAKVRLFVVPLLYDFLVRLEMRLPRTLSTGPIAEIDVVGVLELRTDDFTVNPSKFKANR